jgi:hypothetical protein
MLVVAAVVSALLLALVLWSRPGSTKTVRVEASGNTFHAYVDGKLEQPRHLRSSRAEVSASAFRRATPFRPTRDRRPCARSG